MKKRVILPLASLFLSCSLASTLSAKDGPQGPIPLMVAEVEEVSEVISKDLPGRVSAFRTAEVRARVNGIIEKRAFVEGSNVNAGDVLFKIEDSSLSATYRARQADVANAVAAANLAKQTLKRYKKLLKLGAVSRQEYDTNAAQNQQRQAQVAQAKANLDIAKINLDYATVTAPISGRIGKALVTEGALTAAGTTQLATIEQLSKVYIDFTRSSAEMNKIRQALNSGRLKNTQNKNIEVMFDDGSAYPEKGRLDFSSTVVDQATGSISLRAVVDNPNFVLLPGMFVRVKVPVASTNNAIRVPQKAVSITPMGAQVFMIKDGNLVPQKVELGPMKGENWFVKSGLKKGERVVISDTTVLKGIPGAKFMGMTAAEMQAQGVKPPDAKKQ